MTETKRVSVLVLMIFILAFGLRFFKLWIGYPFADDHARDVRIVREHLEEMKPFSIGPKASVDEIYVQPLYYYLLSIPIALGGGDPFWGSFMIVVLDSLAIFLVFALVRGLAGTHAGLVSSVLYALSPFFVMYGSFDWSPNLVSISSILALLMSWKYLYEHDDPAAVWASLAGTAALHMHFQGGVVLMMVMVTGLMGLLFQRRSFFPWMLSAVLFVLSFAPSFLLSQGRENFIEVWKYFTQEQTAFYQTTRTLQFLWNSIPRSFELSFGWPTEGYDLGRMLLIVSLTMAFLFGLKEWIRDVLNKNWFRIPQTWWLLGMYAISVIGLRIYKGDKLDYYLLFMASFPLILLGMMNLWHWWGRLVLVLLAVLISFHMGIRSPYSSILGRTMQEIELSRDPKAFTNLIAVTEQEFPGVPLGGILYDFYAEPIRYIWNWRYAGVAQASQNAPELLVVCSIDQRCSEPFSHRDCGEQCAGERLIELFPSYFPERSLRMDGGKRIEVVKFIRQESDDW